MTSGGMWYQGVKRINIEEWHVKVGKIPPQKTNMESQNGSLVQMIFLFILQGDVQVLS